MVGSLLLVVFSLLYLPGGVPEDRNELLGDEVHQLDCRLPQPPDLGLAHLVEGPVRGEQAYPHACWTAAGQGPKRKRRGKINKTKIIKHIR